MGLCVGKQQQQEKPEHQEPEKTSVWWDIENCRPPSDVNPFDISRNISLALNCKGPLSISAYGDINQLSKDAQNALTSTGISLNHIPSGKKDASDKAILVNMAFWSQDNPPPANIMLISGDTDFSAILHQLRMRKFNVLLARPEGVNVSDSLTNATSTVWYWSRLARGEIRDLTTPRTNKPSLMVKGALFKLREELMLPTEMNIRSCIIHDKKQRVNFNLQSVLDRNVNEGSLEAVTWGDEQVYVPRGCKLWDCMDTNTSRQFHPDVWHVFKNVLVSGSERVQAFERSSCQYESAMLVRKHGKFTSLSLGEICSLMQQAKLKSWIKPDPNNWSPVLITMKQAESSCDQEAQQVDDALRKSNSSRTELSARKLHGTVTTGVVLPFSSTGPLKIPGRSSATLEQQVADCRILLEDKALAGDYPLSNFKADFSKKFGYALDHFALGFPKLSDFILAVDERVDIQAAAPDRSHKLVRWKKWK